MFGKKSQGPKLAADVLAHEKGKVFTKMNFIIPKSLRGHLVTLSDGDASSLPVVDVVVTRASKRQKIANTEPQAKTEDTTHEPKIQPIVKAEPQEPKTQPHEPKIVKTEPVEPADTTSGAEVPASAVTVPHHGESSGDAAAANPLMLCNDDDDL